MMYSCVRAVTIITTERILETMRIVVIYFMTALTPAYVHVFTKVCLGRRSDSILIGDHWTSGRQGQQSLSTQCSYKDTDDWIWVLEDGLCALVEDSRSRWSAIVRWRTWGFLLEQATPPTLQSPQISLNRFSSSVYRGPFREARMRVSLYDPGVTKPASTASAMTHPSHIVPHSTAMVGLWDMNVQTNLPLWELQALSPATMSIHVGHVLLWTRLNLSEMETTSSKSIILPRDARSEHTPAQKSGALS